MFGYSVAPAGDVDGDGYCDVIVGAPLCDDPEINEGSAFLYTGSASGLNTTPLLLEVNQAGARYGYSAATAGDVDGDGYSDVIVGAQLYDNGESNEGAAFLYYGNGSHGIPLRQRQMRSDLSAPIARWGSQTISFHFSGAYRQDSIWKRQIQAGVGGQTAGTLFNGSGTGKNRRLAGHRRVRA